jgi:type I restriction-modification system DNA methylase subunit
MTGEVFTPTELVKEMLDNLPSDSFTDPEKTFCDPSCGNGQFLSEVLLRKLQNGIDFETALSTIYGVDIMLDNVKLCQDRLLCGVEELRHIVEKNIVCADALKYDFSFE